MYCDSFLHSHPPSRSGDKFYALCLPPNIYRDGTKQQTVVSVRALLILEISHLHFTTIVQGSFSDLVSFSSKWKI